MRKRVDNNQSEIIKVLKQIGAGVVILSDIGKGVCDILVGFQGKNYLMEIKNPDYKWRLTKMENNFFETWPGQKTIITNKTEALQTIGIEI